MRNKLRFSSLKKSNNRNKSLSKFSNSNNNNKINKILSKHKLNKLQNKVALNLNNRWKINKMIKLLLINKYNKLLHKQLYKLLTFIKTVQSNNKSAQIRKILITLLLKIRWLKIINPLAIPLLAFKKALFKLNTSNKKIINLILIRNKFNLNLSLGNSLSINKSCRSLLKIKKSKNKSRTCRAIMITSRIKIHPHMLFLNRIRN